MMKVIRTLFCVTILMSMIIPSAALAQPINQSPAQTRPAAPTDVIANITILHTNDLHGQLEMPVPAGSNPGYSRTAKVINDVRASVGVTNTLLLDAGDMMQGSLLSNLKKGKPVIDVYNLMNVAAVTFGNHEFDWGQTELISRTMEAHFPFVSSNIVVNNTGDCSTANWTPPAFAQAWITRTVGVPGNQAVIGIMGVTTIETPYITIAANTNGLCFKDPTTALLHYYDAVKAQSDAIIVLSHNGLDDGGYGYGFTVTGDKTIAHRLFLAGKPVNLIIGGHSHTNIATPGVIQDGITIGQAYYNGRKVGRADLVINKTTGNVTVSWQSLSVPTSGTGNWDTTVEARIQTWVSDPLYQAKINQVIGFTNVSMVRNYNGDNLVGEFVNDSILSDLNNDLTPANDADMVFNNAGGLRADIVAAAFPFTLTYGVLFNVLPFGNQTVVGDMTGAQIVELLNQSATLFKGAIQPAGVRFKFYRYSDALPGPQPYAWGAYDISVRNRSTGLWEPLQISHTYRVATNEFLAPAGQDGYVPFKYMTNISYWGDMLDGVDRWVAAHYPKTTPYNGPFGDGQMDGRVWRNGGDAIGTGTIIPLTILHHNDSHGRLLKTSSVGYTQLATLIKQERAHNATRTMLLAGGDQIQGDSMMYYFKTASLGYAADGTPIITPTMHINPMIAAMNTMNYTAMTLGNHEFNYGHLIFTSTLQLATFPILQANLVDTGAYGIDEVPVEPYTTLTLPGFADGAIKVAILGIGNHRVPYYELPSNIPGLTFTNPITEAKNQVPGLRAVNDVVIALTHIGFTTNPKSIEVDANVDTNLAAAVGGIDAIIGAHSHSNPAGLLPEEAPYKFLPTIVGNPYNQPVIINQAYRYNNTLGEVILGVVQNPYGGYSVVARAGRYIPVDIGTAEDPTIKAILTPYANMLSHYNNTVIGSTLVPIDALAAFTQETNAANLQADASLYELGQHGIHPDFHLSGAMTNSKIAGTGPYPVTLLISDMFSLMPYENSLVVMNMNGPQLKAVLERGYRNYFYYKYYASAVPPYGGYDHYTTCMLDTNTGNKIVYLDTYPALPDGNNVLQLVIGGQPVNFSDASTFYNVSTVNYLAAGSCNFKDSGVSLWPLNQITNDTQYYVRDAVIHYVSAQVGPISPAIEGRLVFMTSILKMFMPFVFVLP